MRKIGLAIIVVAALALVPAASWAVISGSAHDLSGETYTDQICNVCHTPHNAVTPQLAPLWNHASTTETFTQYTSPTFLDGTGSSSRALGDVSKACLSCHDGITAVDSFGGATGSVFITGDPAMGTNLSDDHPISFTWPTDTEIEDSSVVIAAGLPLYGSGNDQMECASCHDVHNNGSGSPLLRLDNALSVMCLTCHNK